MAGASGLSATACGDRAWIESVFSVVCRIGTNTVYAVAVFLAPIGGTACVAGTVRTNCNTGEWSFYRFIIVDKTIFYGVYVMQLQADVSQWLSQVANLLPFGYAFGAGMVSAVNPCGFTMLPVYLTLYLGAKEDAFRERSFLLRLAKAVWIALIVTSGFGLLFGLVGALVSAGGNAVMSFAPWIALVIGAVLLLLGVWSLFGKTLSFAVFQNVAAKIGDPRNISFSGFFLFGLAFGGASLSCTLPVFLMVVGGSLASGDFVTGLFHFISYILGMGSVILLLTLGIAILREGVVVGMLKKIIPWVQKISAILLIIAGGYVIYYWASSGLLL